jgi:hypothetical protein
MVQFRTYSELAATISKQFTADSSEAELFPIGKRRRAFIEGLQASLHFGTIISLLPLI